ncbi:MAG: hypothetical protein CXT64_06285 [Methanobacteriota archaeon]|nr:MAG: hypothetical protein CXT64_06285 [Euryarchaeota archaeon]
MDPEDLSTPELSGLSTMLGITITAFGDGECTVEATVTDSHLNKGGVAHGGLHATMLDTALGGALVSALRKEEWCPAYSGSHLYAHGRVIRKGRNIAHLEGEIIDQDGKTIATGKGTWAIWVNRPKSLGGSE